MAAIALASHERTSGRIGSGTVSFGYYRTPQTGRYIALEIFDDSAGALRHLDSADESMITTLMSLCDLISVEVCGRPTPAHLARLAEFGAVICAPLGESPG